MNDEIETIIRQIDGSMALSGLPLTEDDKERIRTTALHPDMAKDILLELIRKHTKSTQCPGA